MSQRPAKISLVSIFITGLSQAAWSGPVGKPDISGPLGQDYFIQLVGGLAVVLLSIIALAWILKKLNRLPNKGQSALEIVATLSVGQRERLVIIRTDKLELLLGVAPGNITKLYTLNSEEGNYPASRAIDDLVPTDFSALMAKSSTDVGK